MSVRPYVAIVILAAACTADPASGPAPPSVVLDRNLSTPRYEVEILPVDAHDNSRGNGINERGWVAGFLIKPDGDRHAALWRDGRVGDLGTLGGRHSAVIWPGINASGIIVGISQTSTRDPLDEEWSCEAFIPASINTCVGFAYIRGQMTALPTLGGNNGFAADVNDRGDVVGWAETSLRDPTCVAPQVLQFKAVKWDPIHNKKDVLRPYPGDSASAATAINDRGQVVGISGDCDVAVGRYSARRAVLWERGRVIDIGNLGGTSWHTPMDINEEGEVVGFSNPPGDAGGEFIAHAFYWSRKRGIRDLGLLPGDEISQAFGINAEGDIVGRSCGASGCRAVIWLDGVLRDLNGLAAQSPGVLQSAQYINESGVITGRLLETASGRTLAYVARPRRR